MGIPDMRTIRFHYGGYFVFSPTRMYINGRVSEKYYDFDLEFEFLTYFSLLDYIKKNCDFDILRRDKLFYLKPMSILSDLDGRVQIVDDDDVRNMLASYRNTKGMHVNMFTILEKDDIVPCYPEEHNLGNVSREVNQTFSEEHTSDVGIEAWTSGFTFNFFRFTFMHFHFLNVVQFLIC